MSDEHEDPFRYCVYCAADCYADEPEHAADCPSSTGVFPFTEKDMTCPYCKRGLEEKHRMVCSECETPFQVGESYTHRQLEPIDGIPVSEPICLGCAASEALT